MHKNLARVLYYPLLKTFQTHISLMHIISVKKSTLIIIIRQDKLDSCPNFSTQLQLHHVFQLLSRATREIRKLSLSISISSFRNRYRPKVSSELDERERGAQDFASAGRYLRPRISSNFEGLVKIPAARPSSAV